MSDQVDEVRRILAVVDGESGIDPDLVGIFAQKPSTNTVETAAGPRPDRAGRASDTRRT
ncbi:MAG TPA: hypothetical protein VHT21_14120 [Stellaceae bacterium]|nr:hypothetical protein [Stellaceae bacterium]